MKIYLLLAFVVITSVYTASAVERCVYDQSSNSISCGGITCSTIAQVERGGKLPTGYYRIGTFYHNDGVPWFNLYPRRSAGGYWDYYTRASDIGCRSAFGLHPGTISHGCITVKDRRCFDNLKNLLTRSYTRVFDVTECINCIIGRCLRGTNVIRGERWYLSDYQLQVVA